MGVLNDLARANGPPKRKLNIYSKKTKEAYDMSGIRAVPGDIDDLIFSEDFKLHSTKRS